MTTEEPTYSSVYVAFSPAMPDEAYRAIQAAQQSYIEQSLVSPIDAGLFSFVPQTFEVPTQKTLFFEKNFHLFGELICDQDNQHQIEKLLFLLLIKKHYNGVNPLNFSDSNDEYLNCDTWVDSLQIASILDIDEKIFNTRAQQIGLIPKPIDLSKLNTSHQSYF